MKSCKKCGEIFTPFTTLDKHCYVCKKTEQALKNLAKMKKDKVKKQKEDLLTVSDYLKLAQQVFNKWVRLRDKDQGCISCGNPLGSKYDAGHFWSAGGHSSVRFHPDNVHAQCVACNQHKHGNLIPYQEALIKKIGWDGYAWLESFAHDTKKWDKEELKELIATYKKKLKMEFNNDFRYDLQVGQVYEQAFAKLLGSKIEIKRDFRCLETGNIFIEYESRNKPSGIASTEADFWCYWLSDDHCVFIKTEALKSLCRAYINTKRDILGGDMNTSKGILLPLNDLINKNLP